MRYIFLIALFIICNTNLRAEEFVAKHNSYEINREITQICNVREFPIFDAEYQQRQDIVAIKSSADSIFF